MILTERVLTKHLLVGLELKNLKLAFPDFPNTISLKEVFQIRHVTTESPSSALSDAESLTLKRMKDAGWPLPTVRMPDIIRAIEK